jgi:hypothetical protein
MKHKHSGRMTVTIPRAQSTTLRLDRPTDTRCKRLSSVQAVPRSATVLPHNGLRGRNVLLQAYNGTGWSLSLSSWRTSWNLDSAWRKFQENKLNGYIQKKSRGVGYPLATCRHAVMWETYRIIIFTIRSVLKTFSRNKGPKSFSPNTWIDVTKSHSLMELSPSWEADSCAATRVLSIL